MLTDTTSRVVLTSRCLPSLHIRDQAVFLLQLAAFHVAGDADEKVAQQLYLRDEALVHGRAVAQTAEFLVDLAH